MATKHTTDADDTDDGPTMDYRAESGRHLSGSARVALGVAIAREKGVVLHFDPDRVHGKWRARTTAGVGLGYDYLVRYALWNISPQSGRREGVEVYR